MFEYIIQSFTTTNFSLANKKQIELNNLERLYNLY
jgi:hypothetical protein